jgi:predicted nuclease with TOPRIM domain
MGQFCFKSVNGSSTERSHLLVQAQQQSVLPKRKTWIHWRDLVKQLRTENEGLNNEIINLKKRINEQKQQIQKLEVSANEEMEKQLFRLEQTLRNEFEHLSEPSQTDSNFKINNYEYEIQSLRSCLNLKIEKC